MIRLAARWRRSTPTDPYVQGRAEVRTSFRVGTRWWVGLDRYALVIAAMSVLLLAMRQAFIVPYTGLGLSPAQLIAAVLALLWVVTRLVGQRRPAGLGVLTGLLVGRLALLLFSYGLAARTLLSSDQRTAGNRLMLAELTAGIFVVVLVTVLRTRRDLELVLRGLVVGGAISAGYALVEYVTGIDVASSVRLPGLRETADASPAELLREGIVRSQGAAAVPLELGAVTAVLVPVAIGLLFAARARGERAWPWAVAALVLVGGGVVSLSRSVFLAAGLGVVVMMLRWPIRRVLAILGVVVVVVLAALASGARVVQAVTTVLTQGSDDYSLASRSDGRAYVWAQFAHHFWFGQGPGTYDLLRQPILDNQYLSQLMETGTIGLIAFVAVLLGALAYALRATARSVPTDAAELAGGLAGGVVAMIVVNSVLDTEGFKQIFSLLWLLVGLSAAIYRVNVRGPGPALTGLRAAVPPAEPAVR